MVQDAAIDDAESAVPLTRLRFLAREPDNTHREAAHAWFHEPIDQWATQDSNL